MTSILDFFTTLVDRLGFGIGRAGGSLRQGAGWFNLLLLATGVAAGVSALGGPDLSSLPFVLGGIGFLVEAAGRGKFTGRLIGIFLGLVASGLLLSPLV